MKPEVTIAKVIDTFPGSLEQLATQAQVAPRRLRHWVTLGRTGHSGIRYAPPTAADAQRVLDSADLILRLARHALTTIGAAQ